MIGFPTRFGPVPIIALGFLRFIFGAEILYFLWGSFYVFRHARGGGPRGGAMSAKRGFSMFLNHVLNAKFCKGIVGARILGLELDKEEPRYRAREKSLVNDR